MQNERHQNQELSEDEFSGGFDDGETDEAEAKLGKESTTSVGQVNAESDFDYHGTNGKKSFPETLYQSLAPPPVAEESAITAEEPVKLKLGDSDSDENVEALRLQEIKMTDPLLSPPKGAQKQKSHSCQLHRSNLNHLDKAVVTTLTLKTIGTQGISKYYFCLKTLPERSSDVRWSSRSYTTSSMNLQSG